MPALAPTQVPVATATLAATTVTPTTSTESKQAITPSASKDEVDNLTELLRGIKLTADEIKRAVNVSYPPHQPRQWQPYPAQNTAQQMYMAQRG